MQFIINDVTGEEIPVNGAFICSNPSGSDPVERHMRFFLVNCPKVNQLCNANSGAWVPAITVCRQRLF